MRIDVLGVGFDNITKKEAVREALSMMRNGGAHYVVTPNPEIVEVCRERPDVNRAVNSADLVLPDGIGVIKGAAMLGTPLRERVPGIEFATELLEQLSKTEYSIYFLGGKPGIAVQAAKNLARRYPGLRCAGFRDGYFHSDAPVVEEIKRSQADVVFVCLGVPKQELWMMNHGAETGAKLLCGLGGSLDVFAGAVQRAPAFWCDHNLEWLYRLLKEPWRWKRMLKLPLFLLHVHREKNERRKTGNIPKAARTISPPEQAVDVSSSEPVADAAMAAEVVSTEETPDAATVLGVATADAAPEEAAADKEPDISDATRQIPSAGRSTEESMSDYENQDTTKWDAEEVRQSTPVPRRRRRKKGIRWYQPLIYLFVVLLISTLLASFAWELASDLCAFNRGNVTNHTVEISPGDSLDSVIDKLYDAGLIRHKAFFRLFADVTHAEEKIGAGTYTLNTDMDYRALVVGMRNTSSNLTTSEVKITIPEGYTVRDICALLAEKGVATEDELLDAASNATFDFSFIDNTSHDISRLEGYLFPDTYDFYTPENPERALSRLLNNFARKIDAWETEMEEARERGYDLQKLVTIASLIEKETDGTDQARIASVIYNRLDGSGSRGGTYGLLQIDAALLYDIPDHTGPVTSADLERSSPYNLYKNAGLPPTAIANPGARSLLAAMSPEETDYYYYALAKDNKHRFFTNYSEFSRFLASSDYIGN